MSQNYYRNAQPKDMHAAWDERAQATVSKSQNIRMTQETPVGQVATGASTFAKHMKAVKNRTGLIS